MAPVKTVRLKCPNCGEKFDGCDVFSSTCPNCEEEVLPSDEAPESESWNLGGGGPRKNAARLRGDRSTELTLGGLFLIACIASCVLWYRVQSQLDLIQRVNDLEARVAELEKGE